MLSIALRAAAAAGDAEGGASRLESLILAAASPLVGVLLGALTFPLKWIVESLRGRRRQTVAACREAHRLIRTAQLNIKYAQRGAPAAGQSSDANWFAQESRAWDEAQDAVDQVGGSVANCFAVLADLWRRSSVVPQVWGPYENDPGPAIRDQVLTLLQHRIKHVLSLPDHAALIALWSGQIKDAEDEYDWREKQLREANQGP